MAALSYRGQVVIITDATTAFAQDCISNLSARGAKLVLNYPPKSTLATTQTRPPSLISCEKTQGQDSTLKTFQELKDADKIVASAVERYGGVHVLINNASARSPTPSYDLHISTAWDSMRFSVIDGAFKCSKAVWPHFRKSGYGRILFVDPSSADLGVAEYAARFAIFGFAETLAREGAKYDIGVNLIVPQAPCYVAGDGRRLASVQPTAAAALATSLVHDSHKVANGSMYSFGDDSIVRMHWERSKGIFLNPDINFNAGALATKWSEVFDFSKSSFPTSATDFGKLLPKMQKLPANTDRRSSDFAGKVVLVTGGGSGLGRAYSRAFAKQGASVVVIDRADPKTVIDEIRRDGGEAAPVIASVEEGDFIVEQALSIYGNLDILVNNAGFVADKSFANMDESLWDRILNVHLEGTYRMTKAVWPHFVRQRHGCIVNTTSTSGIYGNFGQANYAAAKLGILGISEATAREGQKHNIRVNTIAPVASTGGLAVALSNTNDKNKQPVLLPEYCAPLVLLLTSDKLNGKVNDTTGGLFEVGCGWHANTRLRPSSELKFTKSADLTPEALSEFWSNSGTFPDYSAATTSSTPIVLTNNNEVLETIATMKKIDVEHVEYQYTDKEVLLYNISIGAKREELPFVWEESRSFTAIPTFGVIPFFSMETVYYHGQILPGFQPTMSLLGEIYLEILQDTIPTSGHLSTTRRLIEVQDKVNAAVAVTGYTTSDKASGIPLFYNELAFFMRGAGGFGGTRDRAYDTPASRTYAMPSRQPDAVDEFQTFPEQAVLYRLTGDRMAMHVNPQFSSKGGFPVPILHGMCFMGIAGRQLFQKYGMYRSIKVKFVGPVVPGQSLRTESWKSDSEKDLVLFQTKVVETGKLCIAGGGIRLSINPTALKSVSRL